MNTMIEIKEEKRQSVKLGRRAEKTSVVLALPQPGGADILRAKKQLKKS